MSNKYKRKLQKRETKLWQDIILLLPVLFGLCIVPMIVLTHDYTIDFSQFDWFNNSALTGQIDSFGHAKEVAIVIAGIAAILFFCYYYWKQTSKYKFQPKTLLSTIDKRIAILLGIHLVMIIISSLTSKYSDLVYNGGGAFSIWNIVFLCLLFHFFRTQSVYPFLWINDSPCPDGLSRLYAIHRKEPTFVGLGTKGNYQI